ncbi:hypothetical protein MTY59_49180 [Mycobacterium senriense]|uniref:Transposase n=1 Tax=Mycobacterium senriense TaxID=2775496 RepID=A0ABN6IPP6_9MYCO|nr:hypothetical protein MTY59_49180 [Mycobacterium senriense]
MFQGRYAPAQPLTALQYRQLPARIQRVERQSARPVQVGIQRIEHRVDILGTTCTHTAKLAAPTDKKRRFVATETTVTQGITENRERRCDASVALGWIRRVHPRQESCNGLRGPMRARGTEDVESVLSVR